MDFGEFWRTFVHEIASVKLERQVSHTPMTVVAANVRTSNSDGVQSFFPATKTAYQLKWNFCAPQRPLVDWRSYAHLSTLSASNHALASLSSKRRIFGHQPIGKRARVCLENCYAAFKMRNPAPQQPKFLWEVKCHHMSFLGRFPWPITFHFPTTLAPAVKCSPMPSWKTHSRGIYVQSKASLLANHSSTLFRKSGAADSLDCLAKKRVKWRATRSTSILCRNYLTGSIMIWGFEKLEDVVLRWLGVQSTKSYLLVLQVHQIWELQFGNFCQMQKLLLALPYSKCNLPGLTVSPETPKIVLNGLPLSDIYEKCWSSKAFWSDLTIPSFGPQCLFASATAKASSNHYAASSMSYMFDRRVQLKSESRPFARHRTQVPLKPYSIPYGTWA